MPPALLCFMVTENCEHSVAIYRKGFFLFIKKKEKQKIIIRKTKQMVPIKNVTADVNHIIVSRFREVYSDLGWLPRECHDPEAAESFCG